MNNHQWQIRAKKSKMKNGIGWPNSVSKKALKPTNKKNPAELLQDLI
jgi:hypothetical protein